MENIIFNLKEANILCPAKRIYQFYLYSRYLLNLKKIYFNKKINKNCDTYLIDQECISKIDNSNNKFIIFFWNGQFDYDLYFKNQILMNNKNVLPLVFGNTVNLPPISFNKIHLENNTKIIGINLIRFLDIKFTFLKIILRFILNPFYTFQNLCSDKLIFVGSGILKGFSNNEKNFQILNKKLIDIFNEYCLLSDIEKKQNYLISLNSNEKLNQLKLHEKCYFLQSIFRDILINKLLKFKNFRYFSNDKNLSIQRSFLFKNNYFLDLGSKLGGGEYYERTLNYIMYKKKYIRTSFFTNKKIDDKSFFSKNILMNDFLTKIDDLKMLDLTGKGLALEIQKLFLELIKKENGTD